MLCELKPKEGRLKELIGQRIKRFLHRIVTGTHEGQIEYSRLRGNVLYLVEPVWLTMSLAITSDSTNYALALKEKQPQYIKIRQRDCGLWQYSRAVCSDFGACAFSACYLFVNGGGKLWLFEMVGRQQDQYFQRGWPKDGRK